MPRASRSKFGLAEQDAARAAAAKAAAERAVADAEAQIAWAMTVTEEAKVAAEEKRDQAQADLDAVRARLNIWRKKLADTSLAPATLEKYMRSVTSAEGEEADLRAAVARAEADVARTAAALADRPAAIAAANEARRQAVAALAGLKGSAAVNVEPWQRLYAELAKPPVILSGISSGEGVIFNIRDARKGRESKDDDPGVEQKRMLITLAEFGSVLALVRRPGSTLSSVIRNAYDCTPLETAAKVDPVRCAQPYITLSAAITPAELFGMLFDARDTTASADNGLGNRPLYLYAVREKLVANPKPTAGADRMAEEIAKNIHSVYGALQPTKPFLGTAIPFTPEAAAVYEQEIYPELNAITGHSINASKLFGRLTTNARKIAGILAVIAGEPAVSVGAIKAAAAWVRHGAATVNALASTVDERLKTARAQKAAETVLEALGKLGGPGVLVPQREVRRAAHLTAEQMTAAIGFLTGQAPSPIRIEAETYTSWERRAGAPAGDRARPMTQRHRPPTKRCRASRASRATRFCQSAALSRRKARGILGPVPMTAGRAECRHVRHGWHSWHRTPFRNSAAAARAAGLHASGKVRADDAEKQTASRLALLQA